MQREKSGSDGKIWSGGKERFRLCPFGLESMSLSLSGQRNAKLQALGRFATIYPSSLIHYPTPACLSPLWTAQCPTLCPTSTWRSVLFFVLLDSMTAYGGGRFWYRERAVLWLQLSSNTVQLENASALPGPVLCPARVLPAPLSNTVGKRRERPAVPATNQQVPRTISQV